jgi:hypothetical protein
MSEGAFRKLNIESVLFFPLSPVFLTQSARV